MSRRLLLSSAALAGLLSLRNEASPDEQLKAIAAQMKSTGDDLKTFAETAKSEIKKFGDVTALTKTEVDKLLLKQTELDARFTEIEQKMARHRADPVEPKTIGQMVVENDATKKLMAEGKGRALIQVKNVVTSLAASAGTLIQTDRRPGILGLPERRLTVRDLLTPGRTTSNLIEYIKELGFTNSAGVVSEGVQKPQSDITFEQASAPVRTIAHWLLATRQILADAAQLQSYIDGRLRYGLAYVEELQLLKGTGVGQNLEGIVPQATAYSAAFVVANSTPIDTLRLAFLQSELAEFPATGAVLHPTDWARVELTKDADGRYIWANPLAINGHTLWGRPVVTTQAMDEDEFLVGAFRLGAQIFDREDADVLVSTEDRDNFVKNMVTILAEERLALAVYRPEAFVTGDLGNVT